jgi:hypothetical protein
MRESRHKTAECRQYSSEAAAMILLLLLLCCILTSLAELIMEASSSFREFVIILFYLFNITSG